MQRENLLPIYCIISIEFDNRLFMYFIGNFSVGHVNVDWVFLSTIHVFPLYIFDVFMLIAYLISIQIDINHTKTTNNIYVSLTTSAALGDILALF